MPPNNSNLKSLMNCFSSDNIIKHLTYFNSVSPTFIDLMITADQGSFLLKSCTFEGDSSDYHKVITATLRRTIHKRNLKTIFHRDCKSFNQSKFNEELKSRMVSLADLTFPDFQNIFLETLDNFAPIKK